MCRCDARWRVFHRSGSSALPRLSLTTEAEWEYLARAGATTAFTNNRDTPYLGWVGLQTTLQVRGRLGAGAPMLWVSMMFINVREWTWDRIRESVAEDRSYATASQLDPTDPSPNQDISSSARYPRRRLPKYTDKAISHARWSLESTKASDLGFRLVRTTPFEDWSVGAVSSTFQCATGLRLG